VESAATRKIRHDATSTPFALSLTPNVGHVSGRFSGDGRALVGEEGVLFRLESTGSLCLAPVFGRNSANAWKSSPVSSCARANRRIAIGTLLARLTTT
jgi:hypothetical protein